jgi:hypothetical protein
MNAVFQPLGECQCDSERCTAVGTKLNKLGHISRLCTCFQCQGTRNQRKGKASERRGERQLGNKGRTVGDDRYKPWPLEVSLEDKTGGQIPQKFISFVDSKWVRDALFQATKKTPIGEDALPAIRLELSPSRAFLLVDISPKPQIVSPTRSEG